MSNEPRPNPISLLFKSRKFILALLGIVGAIILFASQLITADQLAESIQFLIAVLIAAIAGEDMAMKINHGKNPY